MQLVLKMVWWIKPPMYQVWHLSHLECPRHHSISVFVMPSQSDNQTQIIIHISERCSKKNDQRLITQKWLIKHSWSSDVPWLITQKRLIIHSWNRTFLHNHLPVTMHKRNHLSWSVKAQWQSFWGIPLSAEFTALLRSCMCENIIAADLSFTRGNSQKSHAARYGLCSGWGKIWTCSSSRYWITAIAL